MILFLLLLVSRVHESERVSSLELMISSYQVFQELGVQNWQFSLFLFEPVRVYLCLLLREVVSLLLGFHLDERIIFSRYVREFFLKVRDRGRSFVWSAYVKIMQYKKRHMFLLYLRWQRKLPLRLL